MFGPIKLKNVIGETYNVDLNDIEPTKRALNKLGYYKPPSWGFTEIPDNDLFDGIKKFQRANKLTVDGIMKPDGPTLAALNHLVDRRNAKSGRPGVDSRSLSEMFEKAIAPDFHADGSAESTRCCATGTCDISW